MVDRSEREHLAYDQVKRVGDVADEAGTVCAHPLISRVAVLALSPSVVLESNGAELLVGEQRVRDLSATIDRHERDIA